MYEADHPMIYVQLGEKAALEAQQVARRLKELEILDRVKRLGPISIKVAGRTRASRYTLWGLTDSAKQAIAEVN